VRALTPALVGLLLGGCASRGAVAEPFELESARDEARELTDALSALDASAAAALRRQADCDEEELCATSARICELSERICAIADRHPGDPELSSRCADGRRRCARTRSRVREACGCPPE